MPVIGWRALRTPEPHSDYVVMASRLPLRRHRSVPTFLRLTWSVTRQLGRSEGLVGYALDAQLGAKTFWTLSAWESRAALDRFARAEPHAGVMRALQPKMGATRFLTWTARGEALPPSWDEARQRLAAAG